MQRDSLYFQGELTLFEMASVTALNSIYFNSASILIQLLFFSPVLTLFSVQHRPK